MIKINPELDLNNFDEVAFDKTINLLFVNIRITRMINDDGKKYTNIDIYTK